MIQARAAHRRRGRRRVPGRLDRRHAGRAGDALPRAGDRLLAADQEAHLVPRRPRTGPHLAVADQGRLDDAPLDRYDRHELDDDLDDRALASAPP